MHCHLSAVTLPLERGCSDELPSCRVLVGDGHVQNMQSILVILVLTGGASTAAAPPNGLPRPAPSAPVVSPQPADSTAADEAAAQQSTDEAGAPGGSPSSGGSSDRSSQAATSAFAEVPENRAHVHSNFVTASPRLDSPKDSPKESPKEGPSKVEGEASEV